MVTTWQAPTALTHHNWHDAMASCQLAFEGRANSLIDWSDCHQVDSSALAMLLSLQRSAAKQNPAATIAHLHIPVQLQELAALYEVGTLLKL